MFNSRSDVILPHKKFTWTYFWGYIYPYTPRRYAPDFGDDLHYSPDPRKNCHVVNTHRTDSLQKSFSNSIYAGIRQRSVLSEYL